MALLLLNLATAVGAAEDQKTRVVILGVSHAGQLVSRDDSPAHLAAFIRKTKPDAICVERSPDAFARGDQYEFTYEIQHIVMPLAQRHGIALCPFDWMPPAGDAELAFGFDLDTPPEIRAPSDFQGFLFFKDRAALTRDIFAADDPAHLQQYVEFASTPAPVAARDIARRLYLYRTYMQARHLRAAARGRPGGTLLVVVGEFHKHDLEAILGGDPGIELVQPSSLGRPDDAEVLAATTREQLAAILTFNLLGRQADSGNVDWTWVGCVLDVFERMKATPEARLFRLRFNQLTRQLRSPRVAADFIKVAAHTQMETKFTWTGVEDQSRVDSFFDPYGNLGVADRARIESARALLPRRRGAADKVVDTVAAGLDPRKARQLITYWRREADSAAAGPAQRSAYGNISQADQGKQCLAQ
jgi:hypothetical protein